MSLSSLPCSILPLKLSKMKKVKYKSQKKTKKRGGLSTSFTGNTGYALEMKIKITAPQIIKKSQPFKLESKMKKVNNSVKMKN